jgi:hypothetical protein
LVTYLYFIIPSVVSQPEADAIYFDLGSAFELIPLTLHLHKHGAFGLLDGYIKWYHR